MKRLVIRPEGWPCKLGECPPGLFLHGDGLCFKTDYAPIKGKDVAGKVTWEMDQFGIDTYVAGGDYFCPVLPVAVDITIKDLEVQPCVYEWEEYDE